MRAPLWLAALGALALAGCASLTSPTPLFSPADQIGPAPLTEGVWIFTGEDCSARNARRRGRLPARCAPIEIRRAADGAWSFRFQDHVPLRDPGSDAPELPRAYRAVIVPAVEQHAQDAYAPLYVAEYAPADATDAERSYALIVPIATLPATRFRLEAEISCSAALRDGPIDGVEVQRSETGDIIACTARTQAGVRMAARRMAIERLPSWFDPDREDGPLVFAHP